MLENGGNKLYKGVGIHLPLYIFGKDENMGLSKDFVKDIARRVATDPSFNDVGLCVNVDLEKLPTEKDKTYYSISMYGLDHPIGGLSVVILECTHNLLSVPILKNETDRRLFITGMMLREERSFTDECINDEVREELIFMEGGTHRFYTNNRKVRYDTIFTYFMQHGMIDFSNEKNIRDKVLSFIRYYLPDKNATLVYNANSYGKYGKLYDEIIDMTRNKKSIKMNNPKCAWLSDYISEYEYNIAVDYIHRGKIVDAGINIIDIPNSVEGQIQLIESLKEKGNEKASEVLQMLCKNIGEDGK